MSYITVVTPTYNRAHTLNRLFQSLVKQTFKDFEWMIIDDGSTDDTEKLVNNFKEIANFKIRYYYKENGGRHTAINYSYNFISTKYLINIDSDDEIVPNALQSIYTAWNSIPEEDYDRFWLVSGRCVDSQTNSIIGEKYPENINEFSGKRQHKILTKIKGDQACSRKFDIVKQFPFPEYADTKFVLENTVWEKINKYYDQFCINEVITIYHTDSPDSLGAGKIHVSSRMNTAYYAHLFYINECFDQIFYNRRIITSLINISYRTIMTDRQMNDTLKIIDKWYKRLFVIAGYPLSKIRVFLIGIL